MAGKEEKASLLGDEGSASGSHEPSGNGAMHYNPGVGPVRSGVAPADTTGTADVESRKKPRSSGKRERLKRSPSLDKVEEDEEKEFKSGFQGFQGKAKCPDYFGVKSYLHHFYDTHFYKDPDLYEEDSDDQRYLLNPYPRRRRCTSIWWKVFVWIGANFLIFGVIGVLVGYLVPQRPIIVGSIADNIEIIDREAISFNFNLDVCKLVGLILFCIGGLTLTVALLFPSFLHQYCEEDRRDSSFKVSASPTDEKQPLRSPLEMTIPYTSSVSAVQPDRKNDESIVTQEGMVSINE